MLLKVPVGDGGDTYVEVEVDLETIGGSVELVSDDPYEPAVAKFSLASSIKNVVPAFRVLLDNLRGVDLGPDELSLELAMKIGGETGLIFAKGKTEASFVVKMTWRSDPGVAPAGGDHARPADPEEPEPPEEPEEPHGA
jgi:hypothetical protein